MKQTILVVDDEELFRRSVTSILSGDNREVLTAADGRRALEICAQQKVDVVLLDQKLPDVTGSDLFQPLLNLNEQSKILFVTAYPDIDLAVNAIKQGAFDYLTKPVELAGLELVVERALRTIALEKIETVERYRSTKQGATAHLVGADQGLAEVQRLLHRAAQLDATVLLTGETGTGKSLAAKAVHFASLRREGPFITLNCAAVPAELIESELFGHAKGAFTGATSARRGVFEMAERGSLLLDEIGSMPVGLQSRLLSVLEERTIRRVGSETVRPVDVRVLAATNSDLERAVDQSTFRRDLFYRLNVLRIVLPPLRQRPQDIGPLCAHFLEELAPGQGLRLEDAERARLEAYPWPGNVRELRNALERAIFHRVGRDLQPSRLLTLPAPGGGPGAPGPAAAPDEILPMADMERHHITEALRALGGNLTRTAAALQISVNTLKRKLHRYGLR